MLLRDHPLMSYRGIRNWPPAWTWIDGREDKHPKGEIGILRTVLFSKRQPADRCVLLIFYEESSYTGCLLFDDYVFTKHITELLQSCCNRFIAEIGSIDVSRLMVSDETRKELEKRMEEIARKHAETHDEEIKAELEELSRRIDEMRRRLI